MTAIGRSKGASNRAPGIAGGGRDRLETRVDAAGWPALAADLDQRGFAVLRGLLRPEDCRDTSAWYGDDARFRSRIVMSRHGFGQGEYKYFSYPLPERVAALRAALYPRLAPIANRWMARMRLDVQFPETLDAFIARCHAAGQTRPTPLLLKYGAGDYNCLHQDLYGATVFPIQVAVLLSAPLSNSRATAAIPANGSTDAMDKLDSMDGAHVNWSGDFEGGEFVLVEQRPRMQSRATVVPLSQGDAVIFAVNERPVAGSKGDYRVKMRHGVSQIRTGERHTLGIIFHDAT